MMVSCGEPTEEMREKLESNCVLLLEAFSQYFPVCSYPVHAKRKEIQAESIRAFSCIADKGPYVSQHHSSELLSM